MRFILGSTLSNLPLSLRPSFSNLSGQPVVNWYQRQTVERNHPQTQEGFVHYFIFIRSKENTQKPVMVAAESQDTVICEMLNVPLG